MRKHQFIYVLFGLSLLGIIGWSKVTKISKRSPVVDCYKWGFLPTDVVKYYTNPQKIVIEPWRGQHHVYAVFSVPKGYRNEKQFKLELPGNKHYCGFLEPMRSDLQANIYPPPDHYLLKGYLNTRTALRLIAQGKINELNQPLNWKAGYVKNENK